MSRRRRIGTGFAAGFGGTASTLLIACATSGCVDASDTTLAGTRAPVLTHPEFEQFANPALPALPPDPTNALLADDTRRSLAQEFGHRLFFERRFAGPLLDPDNVRFGGDDPYIKSGPLGNVGETGKVSCASCHMPDSGFLDVRSARQTLSLAAGWTPRRAISLLDVGVETLLTWDGRRDAHWNQIFTPLESHLEINSGRLYVAEVIASDEALRASYEAIFGALPPFTDPEEYPRVIRPGCVLDDGGSLVDCHGMEGDGAEYDALPEDKKQTVTRLVVNLGKALEAYERELRCGVSRFDQWVYGDEKALGPEEIRGAELFAGKAGCSRCHLGENFSDGSFHNIGVEPGGPQELFMTPNDPGASEGLRLAALDPTNASSPYSDDPSALRRPESITSSMLGAFKTPRLRCVSRRPSFFHTGQYRSLIDVIAFKNRGGDQQGFVGSSELLPL
ncbi:MAG TPA: cytochrome c peroxidase, partial [Polyangiaceae bacterium]|nr:cytochrome c peroxidase [Polyangiaceae bacterium]